MRQQLDTPLTEALGWGLGNGYDNSLLAEKRHPSRDDLNQVSTELPVLVLHASGHLGAINPHSAP